MAARRDARSSIIYVSAQTRSVSIDVCDQWPGAVYQFLLRFQ